MQHSIDYAKLREENSFLPYWSELVAEDGSLADNLYNLLKQLVILPHDFYRIITAYCLIPSALAKVVPYLFFYGTSGSGKSTLGKLIAKLHGVTIHSSGSTFASIRNDLQERKYGLVKTDEITEDGLPIYARTELNTCMVWDDLDPDVFSQYPDLYRLFKFGYDRSTDVITISGEQRGTNMQFRCFCPKVFSSVHPLHLNPSLKELQRRLLVIPTKKLEDIPKDSNTYQTTCNGLIEPTTVDFDDYDWSSFNHCFHRHWDRDRTLAYLGTKKGLSRSLPFSSTRKVILLDLIATGLVSEVWTSKKDAINDLKHYWQWFDSELTEGREGLSELIARLVKQEEANASKANTEVAIWANEIKTKANYWASQGWIDNPKVKDIRETMHSLGYRQRLGRWIKI